MTTPTPGSEPTPLKTLSKGQIAVLAAAFVPMAAFGGMGAVGTYTNIAAEFHRSATALGVVAAGEGSTLVLALVLVGLTLLGQSYPAPARLGLWAMPAVAAGTGMVVADSAEESMVYAITPMAMCVSAEGLGFLARRIVIYRTGVDAEAQRRNAEVLRQLAYHTSRSQQHPDGKAREKSATKVWELAEQVGKGDTELGAHLVRIQRERMSAGADAALGSMFPDPEVQTPAIEAASVPALEPATEDVPDGHGPVPAPASTPEYTPPPPAGEEQPRTAEASAGRVVRPEPGLEEFGLFQDTGRSTVRPVPATQPRTREEVHAGYTAERPAARDTAAEPQQQAEAPEEPFDASPPPPDEDLLTPKAREDFRAGLEGGSLPSFRALKQAYGIGQKRAERIRGELLGVAS